VEFPEHVVGPGIHSDVKSLGSWRGGVMAGANRRIYKG